MSDAFEQLRPDVVLVLGDRFEILAAAQACLVHNIPLAHIAGGDTTEGAFDESIRHAITKMAHVHFVTNELSARRVRQLGEDPRRDPRRRQPRARPPAPPPAARPRRARSRRSALRLGTRNLLVTFHPVTLDARGGRARSSASCSRRSTASTPTRRCGSRGRTPIPAAARSPRRSTPGRRRAAGRAHVFASLGQLRYLSLMAQVDAVVGNSSSGLYEAPSFGVADG